MSQSQNVVPQPSFLGGFLCSFLGILAFTWLGNYAMWTAGTLGFAIGCWPKEIFASITTAWSSCIDKLLVGMPKVKKNPGLISRAWNRALGSKYRRLYFMRVVVVLSLSLPWIILAVISPVWLILAITNDTPKALQLEALQMGALGVLLITVFHSIVCGVIPAATMLCGGDLDLPLTKTKYKQSWVTYLRSMRARRESHGLLYCFGFDMFSTLKRQLAVTFMFVFGACAGVLLLAVMALVVLTVLIVRGILLINSRASNIICLAAALAVTTCSAWALADYLSGTLLWIVALATGCVAGSAVVVTRELVTHAFPRLANSTRAFAERTIDSRIRPLTAWWLVPEKAFVTAASASPEQV